MTHNQAAGATLANEASRLRGVIGQFQLGGAASEQYLSHRRASGVSQPRGGSASVVSPARNMLGRIATAFTQKGSAAVAVKNESREDF